jgi:predicted O-linked N-acetylglucosamine transferase (SPINDLY family)
MNPIDALFNAARADHQAGRLAQAEEGYRRVLEADPAHVAAHYLLGAACHGLGRLDDAAASLRAALGLKPDHIEARNHLGIVTAQMGRLDEAVYVFHQVLRLRPDHVEAHRNLGLVLERLGRLDEAAACYRRTLEQQPDLVDVHRRLGALYRRQGRWSEAAAALEEAVRRQPELPETQNDLGLIYELSGQLDRAVAAYRAAIRLRPGFASAYSNMAVALERLGRLDEAVRSAEQAVRLEPGFAGGHNNLGVLLEKAERWEEAATSYREALRLEPRFVEALYNLGSALSRLGRHDETEVLCRQAIALKPDSAEAHHNLAFSLAERGRLEEAVVLYRHSLVLKPGFVDPLVNLGSVLAKLGRLDEAGECCRQAIALQPERAEAHCNLGYVLVEQGKIAEAMAAYREALRLRPDSPTMLSSYLFGLNYDPEADPGQLLDIHRRWSEAQGPFPHLGPRAGHDRGRDRRLRVGYVSPDLRAHAVACFLRPILAHHDPARIEAICYAEVAAPDAVTDALRALAHGWRSTCGLTDAQAAALVQRDGIDILVDLAGHTAHHRLGVFARRPAPVQATYLGYPNTTGLAAIDYILTDALVDPLGLPPWSTEEPFRLEAGFCCYAPPEASPEVSPLPALGSSGTITFGSLHKLSKLNASVLDLWAELLRSLPSSRLVIFRNNLQPARRLELLAAFAARGVAADRLDLRHELGPGQSHLDVYATIDVSLDVFPWCGHTTACESLWMGVPIVTLATDRHAGRMTASVLAAVGLNELIATTPAEYLAKVRSLAIELDRLAALRSTLRLRMRGSRLCDGAAWTRSLELAYRTMWHRWCDHQA